MKKYLTLWVYLFAIIVFIGLMVLPEKARFYAMLIPTFCGLVFIISWLYGFFDIVREQYRERKFWRNYEKEHQKQKFYKH